MDTVRQDTDWSCFAASLAMVTGLDYDLMNKSHAAAPSTFPVDGYYMTLDPLEADQDPEDYVTVYDWFDFLHDIGYDAILHSVDIPTGKAGILLFTVVEGYRKNWSHAVAVDKDGAVTCPSRLFEGEYLTTLLDSCNILVSGFVTVQEK